MGLLILKHRFRESSDLRPKSNTFTGEEGIGMLTSGEYVLEPRQTEPPFELLTELNARVGRRDLFGPPIDDPKVLEKVSAKSLPTSAGSGARSGWFLIGSSTACMFAGPSGAGRLRCGGGCESFCCQFCQGCNMFEACNTSGNEQAGTQLSA